MENKLVKMMKLAPNVSDSLEKINYITAIPAVSVSPSKINVGQAIKESGIIDKSVQKIRLTAKKNFKAG